MRGRGGNTLRSLAVLPAALCLSILAGACASTPCVPQIEYRTVQVPVPVTPPPKPVIEPPVMWLPGLPDGAPPQEVWCALIHDVGELKAYATALGGKS